MISHVCYVVNSVSETSVPATIATALVDYENINVDILAWFDAEPFEGDDRVGVTCLNAPNTVTGLDRETYREARDYLHGYDLIQAHQPHSGSVAKAIGYRLGIPLVSREGNTREGFTRKGRIANGLTNYLADRIVPNSRAVHESFTRWERFLVDDEFVEIIPNGVDLDWIDRARKSDYDIHTEFDIPADAIVVGTASAISEQKAYDTLVHGIASANERSSQRIDLVIAGDGPYRTKIERLVESLEIGEHVHFAGMVDRNTVYKIFGEIDIYAMPSRWEGFANAAVEALGAGVPSVFSDIDPFLLPYRNVALFHRLDDGNDLADRLTELAEDPELRDFYGQKGRDLVEQKYTLEEVAKQYARVYDSLV
jgi:glycosyltransferase involved in cell wall biosynthesis